VFIEARLVGNWMVLPKEQRDKIDAAATFLEQLTEVKETTHAAD
jgi:hypothetical protein